MKIASSLLSSDFSKLREEIEKLEKAGVDLIHLDVMDGHFVPNITFGPQLIKSIRSCTDLPFDVHLMIEHPQKFIKEFAKAGADILTFHYESADDVRDTIRKFN